MYAVMYSGGKQYRVAPGDRLRVESLGHEAGTVIEFSGLLAANNGNGDVLTGSSLANAKVVATVTKHGKSEKIIVFKFKRKKQYKRTQGHRQQYTELVVNEVIL